MNAYFNGENIVSWDVIAYHHKHNSIVLRISNLLQLKRNKIDFINLISVFYSHFVTSKYSYSLKASQFITKLSWGLLSWVKQYRRCF